MERVGSGWRFEPLIAHTGGQTCRLAYCLSGIALNHIGDWNPDFVLSKQPISLPRVHAKGDIAKSTTDEFGMLVNEEDYKVYDFPTADQVKIYYDSASLHLNLSTGQGIYEKVSGRPVLYQANALHLNRFKVWKWASDVFAHSHRSQPNRAVRPPRQI